MSVDHPPSPDSSSAGSLRSLPGWLWILPGLITVLMLSRHSLGDLDIWLHWRTGQEILAGHFPRVNTFSFTYPDRPWVNHEWLFQVLIAVWAKVAVAARGLAASPDTLAWSWNLLRQILAVFLALVLTRPRPDDSPDRPAWRAAAFTLALGLLWTRIILRPEVLSYVFLVLAVPGIEDLLNRTGEAPTLRQALDPRGSAGRLPWLTLLWVQCHGFATLLPGIILLAGLLHPLQQRLRNTTIPVPWRAWSQSLGLSVLALGLTPAGWRGWVYPFTVLGQFMGHGAQLDRTISELVPLAQAPDSLAWTTLFWKLAVTWGVVRIAGALPRPNLLRSLLFLGAATAAWSGSRQAGFMGVTLVMLHGGTWGPGWLANRTIRGRRPRPTLLASVAAGLLVAITAAFAWPRILDNRFYLHEGVARRTGGGLTPGVFPLEASGKLAGQEASARTFANLDAAAFLLGTTDARLFIDGRTEAFPAALWDRYRKVRAGGDAGLRELDRLGVQAVCLALGSGAADRLAADVMAADDWSLAGGGGGGALWLRNGHAADPAAMLAVAQGRAESEPDGVRAADLYLAASRLATLTGQTTRAIGYLDAGLARHPDHPGLLHNRANAEMKAGGFAAAEKGFMRATALNPRLKRAFLNAGVCAMRQGAADRAAGYFGHAVRLDPADFQAWANLAVARQQGGDRPGAIAALEKAVALRPRDAPLRARLRRLRGN